MNMMNGNPTRKGFLGVLVFLTAAPPFTNASSEDSSSLFNLKEEINFAEACWCFLILLTATIIIETFTEWIEWVLQGKGHFLVIVNKVYKEVMILGLISFLLFCSEQGPLLDDLDHSWIISFEFAHILLFFIGISFCLLSVVVCVLVSRGRRSWDAYERYDIQELTAYFAAKKNHTLKFLSGFTPKGQAVQFRLLKHVFIRSHKLPPEFHFQEYVHSVMLNNVDQVLDVEWTSWLAVALLTLAGALVNQIYEWQDDSTEESTHYSSGSTEESTHHRWLGETSSSSDAESSDTLHQRNVMGIFVIPGLCLLAMEIVCLFIIKNATTRVIEAELFPNADSITMDNMVGLLSSLGRQMTKKRTSLLKKNASSKEGLKEQTGQENETAEKQVGAGARVAPAPAPSAGDNAEPAAAAAAAAVGGGGDGGGGGNGGGGGGGDGGGGGGGGGGGRGQKTPSLDLAAQRERAAAVLARQQSSHGGGGGRGGGGGGHAHHGHGHHGHPHHHGHHGHHGPHGNPLQAVINIEKKIVGTLAGKAKEEEEECKEERSLSKALDANGFASLELEFAFPFKSVGFFQKTNDIILLLKCLYLSLIWCYFAGLSLTFEHSEVGALLFILMVAPLALSTLLITPRVYQSEAMLTAVASVDPEILGDTLEKMMAGTAEMRADLVVRLRERIGNGFDKEAVEAMFNDMDSDKDGTISYQEFQQALGKLGLFYSAHQFQALFHALNPKGDQLDHTHFMELIYPKGAHWSVADELVVRQDKGQSPAAGFAQQQALLPGNLEQGYEDFVGALAGRCRGGDAAAAAALEALRRAHREVLRVYGHLQEEGHRQPNVDQVVPVNLTQQADSTSPTKEEALRPEVETSGPTATESGSTTRRSSAHKVHPLTPATTETS